MSAEICTIPSEMVYRYVTSAYGKVMMPLMLHVVLTAGNGHVATVLKVVHALHVGMNVVKYA